MNQWLSESVNQSDGRARVEAAVDQLCARGAGLATFDADGVLWRAGRRARPPAVR